jgi:hypothetical protein
MDNQVKFAGSRRIRCGGRGRGVGAEDVGWKLQKYEVKAPALCGK